MVLCVVFVLRCVCVCVYLCCLNIGLFAQATGRSDCLCEMIFLSATQRTGFTRSTRPSRLQFLGSATATATCHVPGSTPSRCTITCRDLQHQQQQPAMLYGQTCTVNSIHNIHIYLSVCLYICIYTITVCICIWHCNTGLLFGQTESVLLCSGALVHCRFDLILRKRKFYFSCMCANELYCLSVGTQPNRWIG